MPQASIFISYRRDQGSGHAGRLFDAIAQRIGREQVFMDATGIAPGENFEQRLRTALRQCRAMVVVVTPAWVQPRLNDAHDWVRTEIETALKLSVPVVPALVGGAQMPVADSLPPTIRAFAACQAIDLRQASWDDDCRRLLAALGLRPAPRWNRTATALALAVVPLLLVLSWQWLRDRPAAGAPTDAVRVLPDPVLRSLTPSPAEEAALADKLSWMKVNVPVLRQFLALARQRAIPTAQLDSAWRAFAVGYRDLQGANLYDQTSITRIDPPVQPACQDTVAQLREGDFARSIAAFEAGAAASLAGRGQDPARTTYAAWCWWLRGRTQLLTGDDSGAKASYQQALALVGAAGIPGTQGTQGRYFAGVVLPDAARLAVRNGQPQLAIERLQMALAVNPGTHMRTRTALMLQIAALHDSQRQPGLALQWRETAQRLFDAQPDPGDKEEKANALALSKAYDAAGRGAEALALRKRYGLDAS